MAGYKSLQVADALNRVTQQLTPQVTTGTLANSVYGRNTNAPDATAQTIQDLGQAQNYYNSIYSKTGSDYAQDAAVALGKGIVAVPQAAAGIVDLADAGVQALTGQEVQGGRFTKLLDDSGVRFKETQDILSGLYSDGTQRQLQGLAALPGMSTEQSLGQNLSSLGSTFGYVLDNPSLAVNTIIESLPQIAAGGVVGRGAAALGARSASGAIGEGVTMAGSAQANMDRNAEGYTTGNQALGAAAIGVLGGAVGLAGARFAGHQGAQDINNLAAGISAQTANKGFRSLGVGTATEAAEEAAQSSLENVITNISSGKDAIQGLNQDLVLGTLAGAGMGGVVNARSSVAGAALDAVQRAVEKQAERIKQAQPERSDTPTEELANTQSTAYNPTAAIVREAKSITSESTPEEIAAAKQRTDEVLNQAEESLANLQEMKVELEAEPVVLQNIQGAQAAIERFTASGEVEKAQRAQAILEQVLQPRLEKIQQIKEVASLDTIDGVLAERQAKVDEARDMHSKYSGLLNQVTENQTPSAQVFGAPQSFTAAQIESVIADPNTPELDKPVLRALADAVIAQNAVKDIDAVNQQVVGKKFDPNYRSTPQYMEQFAKAIQSGSVPAQVNLLREIKSFEQSHVQKAELVAQALEAAQTQGIRSQIIRTAQGQWTFNQGELLKGDEAKQNGAITVHPTPRGIAAMVKTNEYMQAEAQAITATRNAMEQMQSATGQTLPQQVQPEQPLSFDDAMDSYNLDARANYDFQPERRIEDPRTNTAPVSTDGIGSTEAAVPTRTQPTARTESGSDTTQVQTNNTGAANPVAEAERVASRSVSEDAATEVQTSVDEATKATNEEQVDEVVQPEVKTEAEPEAVSSAEKAEKNPERTAERKKEPKQRNLVIDGFNKRDTVLNRNPDFASRFLSRSSNIAAVESIVGEELTDKQKTAVNDFSKFAAYFDSKLDGLIGDKQLEYRFQDFNQFLLEDGKLPENVKTAVSAAMYSWLAENGSKTLNNEKDVAKLLLLNNVETVPTSVFNDFTAVGGHQQLIIASLGQKAMQALGLKVVSDVDPARKTKLESGLGALAMVSLVNAGYLERHTIKVVDFLKAQRMSNTELSDKEQSSLNKAILKAGNKEMSFLRPAVVDSAGTPATRVTKVIDSAKETKGIIQKMFGVQRDIKLPSLEPVTTTPNTFNRMGSQLPSYTKEMLEAAQKNGYKMSAPAMQFIDNVKREDLRELFGYVNPNADGSFDGMHKKFWEGQLAANQAVERAIDIIAEQRVNLGDDSKEFFFEHTSWTNTRSGYDAAFNLQANKMHRAVAGMSAHVVEVGFEPVMRDGQTTKFGEFLMAVAMSAEGVSDALGIQTVDKMSAESFLPKFQEYLARDYVQEGIEAMASILEGQGDKSDMAKVKSLVKEFDMGAMSVRALQALAQMHIAQRDGQRTFTSDIGFESDGVTNGPVITNVVLNTADADMLEAGGVFTDASKTNVPTNKELGTKDIYEQLGEVIKTAWVKYKANAKSYALASAKGLDSIYSAFGERKGAKPIVTTSTYGAGILSIKRANAREVLDAFYRGLEKAGKNNDMSAAQNLIDAVNQTIKFSNYEQGLRTPLAQVKGNLLELMLTPEQESALFYAADKQHGEAIKNTLDTAMADFNTVRDNLTKQAVSGFAVYDLIRNEAINEALKDTTDVIVDSKGNRQEGLTSDQMKKVLKSIERYTPSVVSGMGNMSTNKKQSSIPLMKQNTVWDDTAMGDQQHVFKGMWQGVNKSKFTIRSSIKRDAVQNPGVSGLVLIIQSIDAMITHTTIGKIPSQNYHDADASAVGKGKEMARIQNEAFVDGVMNTHVNREFVRALLNPLSIALDNPAFAKANKAALQEASTDLVKSVKDAYARDDAKLVNMLTWKNVNQYGTQGGHFVMTNAKRKQIVDARDQLKKDLAKDLALATKIVDAVSDKAKPTTIEGKLIADGTMKGSELVPMLQAELKQFQGKSGDTGKFSQFYDSMLDLITKQLPSNLEVNYFNEVDAPSNVVGLEEAVKNNNPAWYTTGKNGNPQINILRGDKPIRAQVLVHELVHAITVESIAQVRKEPIAHAKAAESLSKLDALYEDIKAKVKADPNATDLMKYATQNVEEFIATGFSYPEFVNYLDSQLAPKAARGKNRIVTALRAFVDSIMGVLESFTGRKYSSKDATALEALILDTTEFLGRAPVQTTGTQATIFGAPEQARSKVATFTSRQVFDALDSNLDPKFKLHLQSMMTHVSDTIYGGLNDQLTSNPDGTWSPERAWEEYLEKGSLDTTESSTTAGFRMTEQETFAVESLYAALVAGLKDKSMSQVYAELNKSFNAAAKKLKPENFYEGDWATASREDKRDAQDMYDFIFKYGPENKEPLARFTAMAIGSEQFNKLLGFSAKDEASGTTDTFEKLVEHTNTALDYVGGLMTNSSANQQIKNRVALLAKELARIDAKTREQSISKVEQQLEKITDFTDGLSDKLRDQVVKLANHDKIANSRFTSVRLASNVTRLSARGDLWTTLDVVKDLHNFHSPNERLGIIGEIVNEAGNNDATKNSVEKLMRITKLNNQMKENIRDTTTKNVMSTFEENGQYLTKDDKTAITTMLRADVQSLTGNYSTKEIADLYMNESFLNKEIAALEKQVNDWTMLNRAKQLGKYMITGLGSPGLAKNAQLIVSGFSGEVVDIRDKRVDLIDRVATLYAIRYTDSKTKGRLAAVMKRELKNKTNGIDTSIKFHKELADNAKKVLFADNITSVMKGYVPEVTNPNKDVRIAHNEAETKLLKEQFYTEVKTLGKDKSDPTKSTARLFYTEEANLQRLVSGAIEIVSTNRKGTAVSMDSKEFNRALAAAKQVPTSPSYDPMADKEIYMIPSYDTKGNVTGFNYEMSAHNRDTLLERNNDFAELLGSYAATNFNKVTVPNQNDAVIEAAYQDYKDNFADNPRAYVTVGPSSNDVGLREVWAMLPESSRKKAIATFGPDGMVVRNDVLLTMFGYRKYSANQSFDKMEDAKSMFEKLYTGTMTEIFGSKAKVRGVQIERSWQESVRLMKDIIVIRNVKTLVSNLMSNAMLLSAHGISPSDIVKDTMMSIRAGMQYRKDMARLMSLRQRQRAGVGDFNAQEQEALKLEDSLSRNPLAGFIEEGMMPTIVEDVDPSTDHYSYKSKMQQRIDDLTENVPASVKTAAKWALVSPDTPLYKFLNNATQMSDFSSKYVMYKYYTTKAKEKLSHDEALQIASDNFVNYDVPTAKGLQYLNDMGIVMFTKYNLRIQKALFQLLKKRPATALAQALLVHSFTNLEAGIDPIVWNQIGNPLRSGAMGLPSALDEPLPIKMMTSVF
ncbi:virion associated RNA polymerase [Acinetobacter phage VB_ApiP_XC38]|uniref:Virion associated RNA polymerase n=1 Tax=Acinetobacter phage VB_ApiP_XC38 TaxID=2655002 RepID=A0A5P8PSH5_9CAUD|nr:virion RNA polymerase [Acinetobacter phage VB_ApiP_XC38]QFR59701.1 virion associated RNA polymerase [Acinetobacter phage VB_ApiP_XC38]